MGPPCWNFQEQQRRDKVMLKRKCTLCNLPFRTGETIVVCYNAYYCYHAEKCFNLLEKKPCPGCKVELCLRI
jgi:hypothetical protein